MDFFQNIFGKVISLMASVIIAVGLVSVPEVPEPPQIEEPEKEVVVEKIEKKSEKPLVPAGAEIFLNQNDEELGHEVKKLKQEIEELKSFLREHYDYVPSVRTEPSDTLIGFLERQKKVYTETIEKAEKIEAEHDALDTF